MMNKKIQTTMMLMLATTVIGILYLAYLIFYPFKTLEVTDAHATNSPKAGETLYYQVTYCKYTEAPATVFRTLYTTDGTAIIPFPAVNTITVPGCGKVTIPLDIYPNTPSGEYYVIVNAVFKLNPIREINYQFRTKPFIIQ